MAGDRHIPTHRAKVRPLRAAAFLGARAARVKAAAGRQIERARNLSLQHGLLASLGRIDLWVGTDEGMRIGVRVRGEDRFRRVDLGVLPRYITAVRSVTFRTTLLWLTIR
jgi:hypothetical protein